MKAEQVPGDQLLALAAMGAVSSAVCLCKVVLTGQETILTTAILSLDVKYKVRSASLSRRLSPGIIVSTLPCYKVGTFVHSFSTSPA